MKKTAFTCALILMNIIFSASIVALPTLASEAPPVGVKEGDWMEYNINVTGTGTPPPTHDVRWMRITILPVQGTAFSANFTVRYANGTMGSAIWKWNFTEGNVEGWLIIPANLGPGDTFYDASAHTGKPVNVTVQRQEQKTVLGATRTVTYGNDSLRHKEWDKATGMFIGSSEHLVNVTNKAGWYIENLTVTVQAIATNIWSPEIIAEPNQTVFLVVVVVIVALIALSLAVVARRKRRKE
jgi:subtilase family serine protease